MPWNPFLMKVLLKKKFMDSVNSARTTEKLKYIFQEKKKKKS